MVLTKKKAIFIFILICNFSSRIIFEKVLYMRDKCRYSMPSLPAKLIELLKPFIYNLTKGWKNNL